MKTRTSTILALVLTLAAAGSAHAQSARFAIPAARRQADQAWYQVKLARQQAFNVGRSMGRHWNRVQREARFRNGYRTASAKQVFRIELRRVLQMHDKVIQKCNASVAAYYNRYNVESRYIRDRGALQNLRKRRDQDVQSMRSMINTQNQIKQKLTNYWGAHLARVY